MRKMAPFGLFSLALLSFCALLQPPLVYGSGRGMLRVVDSVDAEAAGAGGVCAASVTIYGYKCEEHEVAYGG